MVEEKKKEETEEKIEKVEEEKEEKNTEEPTEKIAEEKEKTSEAKEPESEEAGKDNFGRTLYKVKCSDCGNQTDVPFKPSGDRPVYCRDCYQKHKPKRY
jgi:CxxC-x17-CxxC domain-containing protein